MIMMAVLLFVPIFLVIGFSFFDNVLVNVNPQWTVIKNYQTVLSDITFVKSMRNTAIFVGASVLFHLIIGMTLAMMVNAKSLRPIYKAIFRIIFLLPWMFNATVIAILWKLLLNPNGIVNYLLTSSNLISGHL